MSYCRVMIGVTALLLNLCLLMKLVLRDGLEEAWILILSIFILQHLFMIGAAAIYVSLKVMDEPCCLPTS